MVGFGMLLVTIGFLASAIASAGLFLMYRRHQTKSSDRIRSLEDQIGELHKGLLEAKLEKSQAMRTAEQVPIIVQKLTEHMPAEAYPPAIVRYVKEITNAVRVGYFVPLPDTEYLVLRVGYGFPDDWQGKMRIASREGAVGQALRKRVVLAREDFEPDVFPGSLPSLEQEGIDPDLVAPVYGISGIEGVLVIAGCNISPGSLKVNISMIADLLSLSIRNAALPEPKEQVAYFDPVTGLANRFHFMKIFEREIRRALNYRQPLSLVRFDIDRSPETDSVVDSQVEYAILREFAGTVKGCTRSSHFLARFGESEFAVLLPSTKKENASRYAWKVRDQIASIGIPVDGHEKPVRRTISGGISAFPEDGQSINELVRVAGDALDEARKGGGNRIVSPQPEGTRALTGAMERQSGTETIPHPEAKTDSA